MTDSQPKEVKLTVICKHCERECLSVCFKPPTDHCGAGHNDCVWHAQVEHNLSIEIERCSNSASDVSPFSNSLEKRGTPVDKRAPNSSVGIIIVGRPGAGKTTIVEKGLFPDCTDFEAVGSFEDPQIEMMMCSSKGVQYEIVMISNVDYNKKADPEVGWRKLYALKDKLPYNIALILFVYRHGRFTDEEKELFQFGKQCFQSAPTLCATVVTDCDGMTPEAKEKIVADFKDNDSTRELAAFMKKEPGICCVSFPDLDKLDPQLQEVYKQESLANQNELSKFLQPNESNMTIDEVLKQPPQQKRFASTISSIIPGPWRAQP